PVGDSRHLARLAHGATGPSGHRQGPGTTGGDPGARVSLCPAAGRLPLGRGHPATGAAAIGGGRVPVPAGAATAGDGSVQACPCPGRGVSALTQEPPPAVSSAHCPGVRGALSRSLRDPAGAAGPSLYGGRPARAGPALLAAGGPARRPALGPCGSDC